MLTRRLLPLSEVVQVVGSAPSGSNPGPLLYEWRIYKQQTLTCVYIGKAKNGDGRPLRTYPKVVCDLHQSRGIKKVGQAPVFCYFQRNPWGYRWIHHELEAAANRICNQGNPLNETIELRFPMLTIPFANLHTQETREIAAARADPIRSTVLAIGHRSIRTQYRHNPFKLDSAWV